MHIDMEGENTSSRKETKNEEFEERYAALQRKCIELEEQVAKQVDEKKQLIEKFKAETNQHLDQISSYSHIIGFTLSKVSHEYETAKNMIASSDVDKFFRVAKQALLSYVQASKDCMPHADSEEAKLPYALCSVIANMASSYKGVAKITSESYGKEYTAAVMEAIIDIPQRTGDYFILVLFRFLSNVAINGGRAVIKKEPKLLKVLGETIKRKDHTVEDLLPSALWILEMISSKMSFEEYVMVKDFVTAENFLVWSKSKSVKVYAPALTAMCNLTDADKSFDQNYVATYKTFKK